ncbi:MAG: IS630 transposase-related protein [Wolbachia pipientis]
MYRWLKKKAAGESLKPSKNGSFIRKIDPKILKEYVTKNPDHTLAEMKRNLGFAIWYRLKNYFKKKSHYIKSAIKKIDSNLPIKSQK